MKIKEYNLYNHENKLKKPDLLNQKISLILPELISSNNKLGERLKNKLKVSTLFNNIEHRNKKYLKGFILSSHKRANFLKTGLDISRALKQNSKNLSLLCNQMKEDIILKNSDFLLKEKKLLNENTEQETHLKINHCIHSLKNIIKLPNSQRINYNKKIVNSMSEGKIKKAKELIGTTLFSEEKLLQDKINNYINKVRSSFDNDKYEKNKSKIIKDFSKYIDNMYLEDNIKLINYTKPKPYQIKDKESANLIRIKKILSSNKFNKKNNKSSMEINNHSYIKKNISTNDIFNNKKDNIIKDNDIYNFDVNGKDTMEVLNNLASQSESMTLRMDRKLKKVNSLIDITLPYPNNYDLVLKYYKNKYLNIEDKKNELLSPNSYDKKIKNKRSTLLNLSPFMKYKLFFLREKIEKLNKRFDIKNDILNLIPINKTIYQNSSTIYDKTKKIKNNMNKSVSTIRKPINNNFINNNENVFITSKNI